MECLLIADDLTGACDAAAPFAAAGWRSTAILTPGTRVQSASVLAVTTESRDLPPAEIHAAMARVAAWLPADARRIIFKKIDSTLRGRPDAEIAAAMEVFGRGTAVVCPAFPAMHRVVQDGFLQVTNAPDFAPIHLPVCVASIHIAPGEVGAAVARGERIVSLDAVCDADLDAIAAEIGALDGPILWAGSAGLAAALARAMGPAGWRPPDPPTRGPVLFCIGSDHPVTLEQQDAMLAQRREHVLLRIPRGRFPMEALREYLADMPAAALMLSGGDTASLVCRALGVESIELCDEIAPGIPRGILRGGASDGLPVVTKSGGFGARDAMIRIADYFSCPNR